MSAAPVRHRAGPTLPREPRSHLAFSLTSFSPPSALGPGMPSVAQLLPFPVGQSLKVDVVR